MNASSRILQGTAARAARSRSSMPITHVEAPPEDTVKPVGPSADQPVDEESTLSE